MAVMAGGGGGGDGREGALRKGDKGVLFALVTMQLFHR